MSKTLKTEWSMATWAAREDAVYVPIDRHIDNVVIDAFGRRPGTPNYGSAIPRRAVRTADGNPAYVMFDSDSDGNVPIIRITEEEEEVQDATE